MNTIKRMKNLILSVFDYRCNFVWAAAIPSILQSSGQVGAGIFQYLGAKEQADATREVNKLSYQTYQQELGLKRKELGLEQDKFGWKKQQDVVAQLNTILQNDVGLRSKFIDIWGGK